jgi:hypothetical protein
VVHAFVERGPQTRYDLLLRQAGGATGLGDAIKPFTCCGAASEHPATQRYQKVSFHMAPPHQLSGKYPCLLTRASGYLPGVFHTSRLSFGKSLPEP